MKTCRLSVSHVRLGVPLPGDVHDDAGQLLLSKGHVLSSQTQLETLLARGMYVDLATFEAHFRRSGEDAPAPAAENRFDPFLRRNTLKVRLHRLLRCILEGSATFNELNVLAGDVVHLIDTDADGAIAASFLDCDEMSHATSHSLGTAILCALVAGRLQWGEARRRSVVAAALTMNLAMLELQQRLLRQAAKLTPQQFEQVHLHPGAARVALEKVGVEDPVCLAAVAQHHERHGGHGYPAGLVAPTDEASLVHFADIVMARCADRADRRAIPPAQAIRALYVEDGSGPAGQIVGALVKVLGLYPPGCFVRLANNEVAVVFRLGQNARAPVVAAVTAKSGTPLMEPVRRETASKEFAINGALTAEKINLGYDLAKLWIARAGHQQAH